MSDADQMERRTWVYVLRPAAYDIAPCDCGNADPDWSEFKSHLWCAVCQKDFVPAHDGIFGGPIPITIAGLLGYNFGRFNLVTQQVEPFEIDDGGANV